MLTGTSVEELEVMLQQSFITARIPFLMATSALGIVRTHYTDNACL